MPEMRVSAGVGVGVSVGVSVANGVLVGVNVGVGVLVAVAVKVGVKVGLAFRIFTWAKENGSGFARADFTRGTLNQARNPIARAMTIIAQGRIDWRGCKRDSLLMGLDKKTLRFDVAV